MIDSVKADQRLALIARVMIGVFSISVNYTALRHFTLMTVSVFNNMAPLVVVILGRLVLGETITKG
jgi:drug/metabolite transporter (DMT)-like permease